MNKKPVVISATDVYLNLYIFMGQPYWAIYAHENQTFLLYCSDYTYVWPYNTPIHLKLVRPTTWAVLEVGCKAERVNGYSPVPRFVRGKVWLCKTSVIPLWMIIIMKCFALSILLNHFNTAYRNKIDRFSVIYQFHQGCGLSTAFRKCQQT